MTRIFDLSLPIDDSIPEPFPVVVNRIGHAEGCDKIGARFAKDGAPRIDAGCFPDGMFISHEHVAASVHCGTHIDAPYHFGPECEGRPARKVSDIPLELCFANCFVLDMTGIAAGTSISVSDVKAALARLDYTVKPGDIALIRTDTDRLFGTPAYFTDFPGMSVSAAEFLMDMGIKVIGTDAPGFDRPTMSMINEYYETGDGSCLWPAHLMGRKREYFHIERLANLGSLPRPFGFKLSCFPIKIANVGAAWIRAVAIFDDEER